MTNPPSSRDLRSVELEQLLIEQRHRDAAADLSESIVGKTNGRDQIAQCRAGKQDDTHIVQAFARFEATLASEIISLRKALRSIAETRWDTGAAEACLTMIKADARAALSRTGSE